MKIFDQVLMERVPIKSRFGTLRIILDDGGELVLRECEHTGMLVVNGVNGRLILYPHVSNEIRIQVEK